MGKAVLDVDVIVRMHVEEKVSVRRIAKIMKTAHHRIVDVLTEQGVEIKVYRFNSKSGSPHAAYYDRDFLIENYVVKRRSTKNIADELGVRHQTIARALRVNGIEKLRQSGYVATMHSHYGWKCVGDLPQAYVTRLKHSAKTRGIEFAISIEYLWKLFEEQNGICALSGRTIDFQPSFTGTASVDRIDSLVGYIEGNVWWLHKDVNLSKQGYSVEQFVSICRDVAARQSGNATASDMLDQPP
jgi:hypothetical protein